MPSTHSSCKLAGAFPSDRYRVVTSSKIRTRSAASAWNSRFTVATTSARSEGGKARNPVKTFNASSDTGAGYTPRRWGATGRRARLPSRTPCRLQTGDTAGRNPALRISEAFWRFAATVADLALIFCLLAPLAQSQTIETNWFPEVISREVGVHVSGTQVPEYKHVVSREVAVLIGDEPTPPLRQAVSRELSIVVTTLEVPAKVTPFTVTPSPTGESVFLSWAGYNEWTERDVAGYAIYRSARPFTNVAGMKPERVVPGETFSLTLTNLPAWQDHYFAVVAVDARDGFDFEVNYAAAYVIAREAMSRECSVFVGDEPDPPYLQVTSREVSVVVTTPEWPSALTNLTVIPTPTGESATLCWQGYNELAQRDVVRYDIYRGPRGFTNVSDLQPAAWVPGETFTLTLTNLPGWQDHYFAVVPVDALERFDPSVTYAAAYVIAREVVSREFSVFIGDEPSPPLREAVSRELSLVVSTPDVPAQVTCLGCGFTVRDAVSAFSAIDLDWTAYNEVGQKDVVRYRIYLNPSPISYTNVSGMEPYAYVPAETKRWTLTGLYPYGVYYIAVVAEDVRGQTNPVVRAQSAQASVDRVGEARNLAAACGTDWLTFTWRPPEGADPSTNVLLAAYYVYLAGTTTPVVLDRWATNYTATNLLPGHGYPVRISTLDISNRVSQGASLLAATLVPNPTQTVVNSFYGTTRVAWAAVPTEAVIDRFVVYLAETNFTSVAGMKPAASTRGHSVDFTGLVIGRTYYFAVTAVNIAGCDSSALPVRVVAHTPDPTTELPVIQFGDILEGTVSFEVSGPPGAEYVLLGSENLEDWFPLSTNTPTATPFTITWPIGIEPAQFYQVLVR